MLNTELSKLYEMMATLNPDFKLNEADFGTFDSTFNSTEQPAQQSAPKNGDVKNYNKASQQAKTLANKSTKINTRVEFPEAFKIWFNNLGYSPDQNGISIAIVTAEIRKVMTSLGYK